MNEKKKVIIAVMREWARQQSWVYLGDSLARGFVLLSVRTHKMTGKVVSSNCITLCPCHLCCLRAPASVLPARLLLGRLPPCRNPTEMCIGPSDNLKHGALLHPELKTSLEYVQ